MHSNHFFSSIAWYETVEVFPRSFGKSSWQNETATLSRRGFYIFLFSWEVFPFKILKCWLEIQGCFQRAWYGLFHKNSAGWQNETAISSFFLSGCFCSSKPVFCWRNLNFHQNGNQIKLFFEKRYTNSVFWVWKPYLCVPWSSDRHFFIRMTSKKWNIFWELKE